MYSKFITGEPFLLSNTPVILKNNRKYRNFNIDISITSRKLSIMCRAFTNACKVAKLK